VTLIWQTLFICTQNKTYCCEKGNWPHNLVKSKSLSHNVKSNTGPFRFLRSAHFLFSQSAAKAVQCWQRRVFCHNGAVLQDISAILRYCVKFGYTVQGNDLLDKLSAELHKRLPQDHASQFTTNVKWLTVFYYYNESLMTLFVDNVMKHAPELDFVALSDVMDALAQVSTGSYVDFSFVAISVCYLS